MAIDINEVCAAPCTLNPQANSPSAQNWALVQLLLQVYAEVSSQPLTDVRTILDSNPCLECLTTQQAEMKAAQMVCDSGLTGVDCSGWQCFKPSEIAAVRLYLTAGIVDALS